MRCLAPVIIFLPQFIFFYLVRVPFLLLFFLILVESNEVSSGWSVTFPYHLLSNHCPVVDRSTPYSVFTEGEFWLCFSKLSSLITFPATSPHTSRLWATNYTLKLMLLLVAALSLDLFFSSNLKTIEHSPSLRFPCPYNIPLFKNSVNKRVFVYTFTLILLSLTLRWGYEKIAKKITTALSRWGERRKS